MTITTTSKAQDHYMIYLHNIAFNIFGYSIPRNSYNTSVYSLARFLKDQILSFRQFFISKTTVSPANIKTKSTTLVFSFLRLPFSHLPLLAFFNQEAAIFASYVFKNPATLYLIYPKNATYSVFAIKIHKVKNAINK